MENFCDEKTGKEREYAADLLNGIKNFSLGYWFNVKYALIDCREIMEAFTLRKYGRRKNCIRHWLKKLVVVLAN